MQLDFQIGIIGAGFSGIIAALRLQSQHKYSFIMLEKAAEIGGTWRDNVYPGCACDVPSHLYSISSEPKNDWSKHYANQSEIWAYMQDIVQKRNLTPHIRFQTEATKLQFIAEGGYWEIHTQNEQVIKVKMLIVAMGPLNRVKIPDFKGLKDFQGKVMHSAVWDKSYDLKGKKVAVIGTGASAIQIEPSIAAEVEQLTVFQRTPAWVVDRNNKAISSFRQWLYKNLPITRRLHRESIYWGNEFKGLSFLGHTWMSKVAVWASKKKFQKEVQNPAIRQKLIPQYTIGCKRVMVSDDYLPTFNRKNVYLETDGIEHLYENGILTQTGTKHTFDTIIMATGFEVADFEIPMQIIGKDKRNLAEVGAKKGIQAYKGTTVSGFPNFAIMLGPNTGLGHSSMIHIMESQMNYISNYIDLLEKQPETAYLDVKQTVEDQYNQQISENFKGTVWTSGCNSWYLNKDKKPTVLYPGLTLTFRMDTKYLAIGDYVVMGN